MKIRRITAVLLALAMVSGAFPAMAAGSAADYTFTGFVKATTGGTEDIENVPLSKELSVTTGGKLNYKSAGITDITRNNEFATYPIGDEFQPSGSYLYLSTASSNDDTVITLTLPEIKKGSKVELTYAKPIVTNNGSTIRNQNDPYAYFEIGDRILCINGGEFNTWRTDSVIIGTDTDEIVFHADKWAAAAIQKISVSNASDTPLHTLMLQSTHYANFTVDGYRCETISDPDEPDRKPSTAVIPSLEEGKTVTVTASKDGYTTETKEITIGKDDMTVELMLECTLEGEISYYESDYGNPTGTYTLDTEHPIKTFSSVEASGSMAYFAGITLADGGEFILHNASGKELLTLRNNNGIYANDRFVTAKNNMEFELFLGDEMLLKQNSEYISLGANTPGTFGEITGHDVTLDYIGLKKLPDSLPAPISGPDKVSANSETQYTAEPEFMKTGKDIAFSVSEAEDTAISADGRLYVGEKAHGTVTIYADYDGKRNEKQVEIVSNPKITAASRERTTLNLYQTAEFTLADCTGEYDNPITPVLKDFKSSDPSVISIDETGRMYAAGVGNAVISVNAYTGTDNILTCEYTVERFYIGGITEADTTYVINDFAENEHITGYKVNFADGTTEDIAVTDIPAASVTKDGMAITNCYTPDGRLVSSHKANVKAGDKVPVSNATKQVYLNSDHDFTRLTEADSTVKGFALSHAAGVNFEIDPIYRYNDLGDVKDDGRTLDSRFANGFYDITFKKAETWRGDIYVNDYMAGNNVDQADADRKVTDGALYTAEDIHIKNGKINISMTDGSTMLDYVTFTKHPEFYERPTRVYVIGDSLACIYYGEFEQEVGGGRAGWGQQLPDYLNVPVTDLANSGQYAAGLYQTAFPSVIENGIEGDLLLIECAYNDRNYSTREEMTDCVKDMISQCREAGIIPILVTPNASKHDYKPSVAWSGYLLDIAADMKCETIDLSKESYDFLYSLYGDDLDNVVTMNYNLTAVGGDTLHSSYAGAYKWASIVAQGLKKLGYGSLVNNDFKYEFTDTLGNKITAEIK